LAKFSDSERAAEPDSFVYATLYRLNQLTRVKLEKNCLTRQPALIFPTS